MTVHEKCIAAIRSVLQEAYGDDLEHSPNMNVLCEFSMACYNANGKEIAKFHYDIPFGRGPEGLEAPRELAQRWHNDCYGRIWSRC